jgi:hypothetical protein
MSLCDTAKITVLTVEPDGVPEHTNTFSQTYKLAYERLKCIIERIKSIESDISVHTRGFGWYETCVFKLVDQGVVDDVKVHMPEELILRDGGFFVAENASRNKYCDSDYTQSHTTYSIARYKPGKLVGSEERKRAEKKKHNAKVRNKSILQLEKAVGDGTAQIIRECDLEYLKESKHIVLIGAMKSNGETDVNYVSHENAILTDCILNPVLDECHHICMWKINTNVLINTNKLQKTLDGLVETIIKKRRISDRQ